MNAFRLRAIPLLLPALIALGCANNNNAPPSTRAKPKNDEATIKASLAKLDPADRELAEAQKYCAIESENRLGAMGKPFKVSLEEETVFLCCEHCAKAAKKDAAKTLARAEELRCHTCVEQLDPADRKLAEAQKYCAVQTENLLGSMGKPIKVTIGDQPVFLCCKHCEKHAKADSAKTLAAVKKLKEANGVEETQKGHHE